MAALQPQDRNVLRAVLAGGLVRGRDILRRTGLKADDVRSSLLALKNENFITLHNGSNNAHESLDAYVAALPSRRAQAEYEASQS
jgi:transcription initiation factor IIE alpha subunit